MTSGRGYRSGWASDAHALLPRPAGGDLSADPRCPQSWCMHTGYAILGNWRVG